MQEKDKGKKKVIYTHGSTSLLKKQKPTNKFEVLAWLSKGILLSSQK